MQVRIQLGEGSAVEVTKKIIRNEGIGGFYKVLLLLSWSDVYMLDEDLVFVFCFFWDMELSTLRLSFEGLMHNIAYCGVFGGREIGDFWRDVV